MNSISRIRIVLNTLIAVAAFGSWIYMTLYGSGTLALSTFSNLKYFTILSNLLEGIASILWVIYAVRSATLKKVRANVIDTSGAQVSAKREALDKAQSAAQVSAKRKAVTDAHPAAEADVLPIGESSAKPAVEVLKYAATVSVGITFLTVVVFLGPLYGYPEMFAGPNLWLHLIVPVAALAENFLLCKTAFSARDNVLALVPVLIYGTGYILNNVINGIGEWPDTNDWYSFLMWGYPVGVVIFVVICLVGWAIGRSIRKWGAGARE